MDANFAIFFHKYLFIFGFVIMFIYALRLIAYAKKNPNSMTAKFLNRFFPDGKNNSYFGKKDELGNGFGQKDSFPKKEEKQFDRYDNRNSQKKNDDDENSYLDI